MTILYEALAPEHFSAIVDLGNTVHGDNYLDANSIESIYEKSWQNDINASWVAIDTDYTNKYPDIAIQQKTQTGALVGFRLTYAANNWQVDKWCSPKHWEVPTNQVCYFKCNTVNENYRGLGIGKTLLQHSIKNAARQGAQAGLAHIWLASPNNSAFAYFSACGGKLVKEHANKWQMLSIEDNYDCPICGDLCKCTAAEMLLTFPNTA
jgi:ribosomal protein S18 acetylase RimI-like enzyme